MPLLDDQGHPTTAPALHEPWVMITYETDTSGHRGVKVQANLDGPKPEVFTAMRQILLDGLCAIIAQQITVRLQTDRRIELPEGFMLPLGLGE